jgi:hypothetical protein
MILEIINYDYEINTFFIATKTYYSVASDISNGDLETPYNAEIREFLPYYFIAKKFFLNEAQAYEKYHVTKYSLQHPQLFSRKNDKDETIFIEPFLEENRIIIEKGTKYFNFFFAVTLNFYFENPENNQFENFLEYQLKINFNNDIEELRKFTDVILRKYSLTIFYGKHEIIKSEFENKFPVLVIKDSNKIKCDATFITFNKFFNLLITTATEGINKSDIEPFIRNNFKLKGKEIPSIKLKSNFKITCKKHYYSHVVAFFWLLIYDYEKIPEDEIRKVKTLLKKLFGIGHDTIENFFRKKKVREKILSSLPFHSIKIQLRMMFR